MGGTLAYLLLLLCGVIPIMIILVSFLVILLIHVKENGHNTNLLIAGIIASLSIGFGIIITIQLISKLVGGH